MEYWMLFVVFVSNVIQGVTGFAGGMLAMPLGIRLIGLSASATIINAMGVAASLVLAGTNRKLIDRRCLLHILLGMLPGLVLGVYLGRFVENSCLKVFYGCFVSAIALMRLLAPNMKPLPVWLRNLILPFAGIIHGLFVSGGSLLVLYAAEALPEKRYFRATLSTCWLILNSVMMVLHWKNGYYTGLTTQMTILCLLTLLPALWVGNYLHDRVHQSLFLKISYVLLLVCGLTLLI